MSTTTQGLTSDIIPPPPFSKDELREQWNTQADVDEPNYWDNLGLDEQLAWAQTRAIAADRAQGAPRDMPPAVDVTEQATTIRYEFEIFDEHDQTVASGDAPTLEDAEREGRHYLARYQQDGPCTMELRRVDVLDVSSPKPTPAAAEPLWRVMQHECRWNPTVQTIYAAVIRAVRDRTVPEDGPRPGISWPMERAAWDARQSIRATLTTEADRAERGE